MTSKERHELRYQRRKAKREKNRQIRSIALGDVADVFSFNAMFRAGRICCNGVRWKNSTQRFETHLFSGTAVRRKQLIDGTWKPQAYSHFTISERGKTRVIDAPKIQDRQIHKVYTKRVLLPLYQPQMIYNNGASMKGKGLHFSQKLVKQDLRSHFKKYGMAGSIILMDFHAFFPTASHEVIAERHRKFILNDALRKIGDDIVGSTGQKIGVPLGVETSQVEMIAYPSDLDNEIKSGLSLKRAGHYMDDYIVFVPPGRNPHEILDVIKIKAHGLKLTLNESKTRIIPFGTPFRYCKAKYTITDTGRVYIACNRDSVIRDRKKFRSFHKMAYTGEMNSENLWTAVNSAFAYLDRFDNHSRTLKLRRLFYSEFGFSPEKKIGFSQKSIFKGGNKT